MYNYVIIWRWYFSFKRYETQNDVEIVNNLWKKSVTYMSVLFGRLK
jgi:hypothetical protein